VFAGRFGRYFKPALQKHGGHPSGQRLGCVLYAMKTKLIAFTFLALTAVFLAGCTTTETSTTTTRTREESSMYAR
jgi:hypothetical protein